MNFGAEIEEKVAHRFDRVKQLLKVILRFVGHSTSSDAFPEKKRRKNSDGKLHRNGVQNLHMPADALSGQTYSILSRQNDAGRSAMYGMAFEDRIRFV